MHVLVHHFSRQLMVSLSCECCDDYDNDDDDINKGHGQLTTAASLTRWQLSWPGSKSPGSSSRIVYIMLQHPILLAPKVLLDYLPPTTYDNHPIPSHLVRHEASKSSKQASGSIIKIFWPIELNDLWSKMIWRPECDILVSILVSRPELRPFWSRIWSRNQSRHSR